MNMLGATVVEETAVELNRQCRIELGPTRTTPVVLPWQLGAKKTTFVLDPAKNRTKCVVPLERAQAWLGFFTFPTLMESEKDPRRKDAMQRTYREERERALTTWGDYPRPARLADGTHPIGPHRFPDLVVTVLEQDGTEWEPIRLHEQYSLGEFDTLQFTDVIAERDEELATARQHNTFLEKQMAEIKGQVSVLLAERSGAKK